MTINNWEALHIPLLILYARRFIQWSIRTFWTFQLLFSPNRLRSFDTTTVTPCRPLSVPMFFFFYFVGQFIGIIFYLSPVTETVVRRKKKRLCKKIGYVFYRIFLNVNRCDSMRTLFIVPSQSMKNALSHFSKVIVYRIFFLFRFVANISERF